MRERLHATLHAEAPVSYADALSELCAYSTTNQRQGKAEISGELVIMNWEPAALGQLF